jgi:hypothetical protein
MILQRSSPVRRLGRYTVQTDRQLSGHRKKHSGLCCHQRCCRLVQFFLFDLLRLVKRVERLALIKVTAPLIRFHVNWLRVGCVDDRIGMNFCDVVSDDFKWHGDHLLSWDL